MEYNTQNPSRQHLSRQLPISPNQISLSREEIHGRERNYRVASSNTDKQVYSKSTSNSKQSSFDKTEVNSKLFSVGYNSETPPNRLYLPIANLGRASSFDSCPKLRDQYQQRQTDFVVVKRTNQLGESPSSSSRNSNDYTNNPSSFTSTVPLTKNARKKKQFIGIKPSIEISTITEGSGGAKKSYNSFESNESSESHWLSTKNNDVSTSVPNMAHLNMQNSSRKNTLQNRSAYRSLVYQPRSFNAPDDKNEYATQIRSHSSMRKSTSKLSTSHGNFEDDFDYFCQIANSPSNKVNPKNKEAPKSPPEIKRRESNRLRPLRSQSIRSVSPDMQNIQEGLQNNRSSKAGTDLLQSKRISLKNSYRDDISCFNNNPNRLNTPRPILRRAATEDNDRYDNERPSLSQQKQVSRMSNTPLGAPITQEALDADCPNLISYQLQIFGDSSVGKTCLCNKLYSLANGQNEDLDEEDEDKETAMYVIKANLEKVTYHITIIDVPLHHEENELEVELLPSLNGIILIYAVDCVKSFHFAKKFLSSLQNGDYDEGGQSNTEVQNQTFAKKNSIIIPGIFETPAGADSNPLPSYLTFLIANKSDLVRGRQVSSEDGKNLAKQYNAKFIEISATLCHQIPEFLKLLITSLREIDYLDHERTMAMYYTSKKKIEAQNLHSRIIKLETQDGCNFKKFKKPNPKDTFTKFVRKHFTQKSAEE